MMFSTNDYIATNVPDAAVALLAKYGLAPVTNAEQDISNALTVMVTENGDPALKDVYSIHPDKDDILHYFGQQSSDAGSIPATAAAQPMVNQSSMDYDMGKSSYRKNGGWGMMNNDNAGTSMGGGFQMNGMVVLAGAFVLAAVIMSNNK